VPPKASLPSLSQGVYTGRSKAASKTGLAIRPLLSPALSPAPHLVFIFVSALSAQLLQPLFPSELVLEGHLI
jgi:hypothetical protein